VAGPVMNTLESSEAHSRSRGPPGRLALSFL